MGVLGRMVACMVAPFLKHPTMQPTMRHVGAILACLWAILEPSWAMSGSTLGVLCRMVECMVAPFLKHPTMQPTMRHVGAILAIPSSAHLIGICASRQRPHGCSLEAPGNPVAPYLWVPGEPPWSYFCLWGAFPQKYQKYQTYHLPRLPC